MTLLSRLPVTGWPFSQVFGVNPTLNNPHPVYGNYQPYGHDGIDIACPMDTPIYAPGDGVVDFSGDGRDMPYDMCIKWGFTTDPAAKWATGLAVFIDHGEFGTYYAHMNRTDLDHMTGQRISAGTLLGLSGNSGRSGGPHVHWSAVKWPINYNDGLYSRRDPLSFVGVETVTPIAPGNTGAPPAPELLIAGLPGIYLP
ncbi:M23 family metallopeptidase [Arthrobacter frigidicola]|nr:M23 family metallopeptidase [Arthrobacter frigidicola]